jgi:ferrochelatase
MNHTAVILCALGGPNSLEDVGPFMTAFMGRSVPPQVVSAMQERYKLIGGKSPLISIVQEQARALENELGAQFKVYAGFRHSIPSIKEVYKQAQRDKATKIIALSMSPYQTIVTTGSYELVFKELNPPPGFFTFIPSFHDNPFFIDVWTSAITPYLNAKADKTAFIFTNHSIPLRHIDRGDPYKTQVETTVSLVANRLRLKHWFLAWQSKGARTTEVWIEPEVEVIMDSLSPKGITHVVEIPIGFTCDHLETLYDIDIVHKTHAEKIGLFFKRVVSLNVHPHFIRALADIVLRSQSR